MDSGKADASKLTGYSDNQFVVDDDVVSGLYEGTIIALELNASLPQPQGFGTDHVFDPNRDWIFHMEFILGESQSSCELISVCKGNTTSNFAFAFVIRGKSPYFFYMDKNGVQRSLPFSEALATGVQYWIDMAYHSDEKRLVGGINNNKTIDTGVNFKSLEADIVGLNGYIQGYAGGFVYYGIVYLHQGLNG